MNRATTGRSRYLFLVPAVVLAIGIVFFYQPVLRALGSFLVKADQPRKADIVVVLAGDAFGERIMKGCQLVRDGFAPKALVSGPRVFYGRHEDEFAIDWAVEHGCAREWFEGLPSSVTSTVEEAKYLSDVLHRRRVQSYLLVTSNFHTRRAGKIFREIIPDLTATIVSAPYPEFDPDTWWKSRQSRKTFAYEWIKTVTEPFGI